MTRLIPSLAVATLTAFIWLAWYRRRELEHPRRRSPRWVYRYFAAGVASIVFLLSLPWYYDVSVPGRSDGFLAMLYRAGIPEEAVKFLAFYLLARNEKLREPFDLISRGALVGLGFAVFENLLYGNTHGIVVAIGRAVLTPQGHMLYAAISATGWGITRFAPELRRERGWQGIPLLGYGMAVILHAAVNVSGRSYFIILLDLVSLALLVTAIVRFGKKSPYRRWASSEAQEALAAIDRALSQGGRDAVLLYRRGLYSMAARQWAEACVHFDGAAMTGAPEAPIHSWYAAALHASGDRDEACALFDEFWPQLSPRERAAFHRTLARMLPGNKAYRDEIRDITRPLEWMPSAPASASRRAS